MKNQAIAIAAVLVLAGLAAVALLVGGLGSAPEPPEPSPPPPGGPAAPVDEGEPERDPAALVLEAPDAGAGPPADAAAEPPPPSDARVTGVVLDADSDQPLPDTGVQLFGDGFAPRFARTGNDGRFELASPGVVACRAVALPRAGWAAASSVALSRGQLEGADEVVLRARRVPSAPIVGTVRDRRTGEPVPALALTIAGERAIELAIVTDDEGAYATRGAFAAELLSVVVTDPAPEETYELHAFEHEHAFEGTGAVELPIEVVIGPTYRVSLPTWVAEVPLASWSARVEKERADTPVMGTLRFERNAIEIGEWSDDSSRAEERIAELAMGQPEAYEELRVRLGADGTDPWAMLDAATRDGLLAEEERPPVPASRWKSQFRGPVTLREGELPWVRFPEPIRGVDADDVRIELENLEGTWVAKSSVLQLAGRQMQPLEPAPEPVGSVAIPIESDLPDDGSALRVELIANGVTGNALDAEPPRFEATARDGLSRFERLPIGGYGLRVHSPFHPPRERDFELRQGENELDPIVFPEVELDQTISGKLVTTATSERGAARILLEGLDGLPIHRVVEAVSDTSGTGQEDFAFSGLPPGRYRVRAQAMHGVAWDPIEHETWTPASNLLFHLPEEGDLEWASWAWQPTELGSGEPLDSFTLLCGPGGELTTRESRMRPGRAWRLPADCELEWIVWANEHQPLRGSHADFPAPNAAGERVLGMDLAEGWGCRLHFRERSEDPRGIVNQDDEVRAAFLAAPPVPDVGLFYGAPDGGAVGVADERGVALVAMEFAPGELTVVKPGWRLVGVSLMDRPRWREFPDAVVWVEREVAEDALDERR